MKTEHFEDRRKRLEEEFLRRRDAALREQRRDARRALAAASRITDEALLDQLVALDIKPDTLIALSLVPLVEVAWADGDVAAAERETILAAAKEMGLEEHGRGYGLLERSLSEPPRPHLRTLWAHYIKSVCSMLSAGEREAFKSELLRRARAVAKAAGGFMALGSRVSGAEDRVLSEIARVFDA